MKGAVRDPARGERGLQSQRVYDALRRDISSRRLHPGEALHEATLSEHYEVSRTPLREALLRLRQEGFVERLGRQLRVKEFTFSEVEEIYQLREALEKMAVRLCIERASTASLDAVGRQIEEFRRLGPAADYQALNESANEFHRALARLSQNSAIEHQLLAIHDKVLLVNERYWTQDHAFAHAYEGHLYILHAIRERDVTVAEAAVRGHVQSVIALYRRHNAEPESRVIE